jgi:glycosyltransferase involved in cell wall biosynthesis
MSKKKIKIIYVLPTLDPGGAEKFIVDLIKNLDRNQFEIKIVLFRHEGFFTEELKKIGIPIISLKKKFKVDPINFYQLYQILKSEKADIIHTELGGDIYGRIIAKMIGTKIIISTEQNVNPDEKPWITWLKKFSAQFADRVICISKAVQKDSLERYLIPKEKMPIIYNGIEIENFFHERDYQKNTLESIKICSLGRLMPQKGFRYLIEAFTLIKDKNFICQIIGEGELRPELEQLIKQNNL